jgi:hypothetical protein
MSLPKIPYFYSSIDRNAILVKPKQPFLDWIQKIYPKEPQPELEEHNIYLIREMDSIEATQKWLARHFDEIFVNELNDWHTDEKAWPDKRSFRVFGEWFEIEIHSMVLDLEETPVTKD